MLRMFTSCFAIGMVALAAPTAANAAGDAAEGEKVYRKCKVCHLVEEEKNRVGPTLNGVIGRTPGSVEGFNYSDAMKAYGEEHVWDEETLSSYLADPMGVVKGSRMAFPGLKDEQDIEDVIAYLKEAGG